MRDYANVPVITGHLQLVPGDVLPNDRYSITLLREPVDRIISEFYFEKKSRSTGKSDNQIGSINFVEWVASLDIGEVQHVMNGQLAYLWPFGWHEPSLLPAGERVEAAKRALDEFDVIGMQDSMAETLALLSYALGGHSLPVAPHDNRTPGRISVDDLPTATLRRLRKILEPDQEVYEHARKLFRQQRLVVLLAAGSICRGDTEESDNRAMLPRPASEARTQSVMSPAIRTEAMPASSSGVQGTRELVIDGVDIRGEISEGECLQVGELATLRIRFSALCKISDFTVGVAIRDDLGQLMFGTNSRLLGDTISVAPGKYAAVFSFPMDLGLGRYWITAALHRGFSQLDGCFDWQERVGQFEVLDLLSEPFEGRVRLRVNSTVESLDGGAFTLVPIENPGSGKAASLGRRNPALNDFSALLKPLAQPPILARASESIIKMEAYNSGSEHWPAFGKREVNVSYRWFDSEGNMIIQDGMRTGLPHDVAPGASVHVSCFLRAPETAGRMKLEWTLVQEGVAWFSERSPNSFARCDVVIV
jgi:hypothetical protein